MAGVMAGRQAPLLSRAALAVSAATHALVMMLLLTMALSSLGLAAAAPGGGQPREVVEAFERADKLIYHLEASSFKTKIQKGDWLVFYGATWCPHCMKLTPVWLELQRKVEKELKGRNIRLAKVECTRNEELCTFLDGFPTIFLYKDGVREKQEAKQHDFANLYDYILEAVIQRENKATEAANPVVKINPIDTLQAIADDEVQARSNINPDGKVVHLTQKTFASMFHAPWCGHCKTLAPIWEQLSVQLIGQANVGKVDCTTDIALRDQFKVTGFPTLYLLRESEPPIEYRGQRTLENLKEFALNIVAKASFTPIKHEQIEDIIKESESAFIYMYNPRKIDIKQVKVFLSVARTVKSLAKIYVAPHPPASMNLKNNDGERALLAVRDGGIDQKQFSGSFQEDVDSLAALRNWILNNRMPLVPKLESNTQNDILKPNKIVVMAIINPAHPSGTAALEEMRKAAHAWNRDVSHARVDDVVFTWVDGGTYARYAKEVYAVSSDDMPSLIIADVTADVYYDSYSTGKKFKSFAKANVHKALQEVLGGTGVAKSRSNVIIRAFKALDRMFAQMFGFVAQRPIFTFFVVTCLVCGVFVYFARTSGGYQELRSEAKAE